MVRPGLRARIFSVRGDYCTDEPIDLVMLIQNVSKAPVRFGAIRVAPEITSARRVEPRFSLALRWRRGEVALRKLLRREHVKTLARLAIKLNPGELHVVTIRLRDAAVPLRKLYMRRIGEPRRLEAELSGRPRSRIRIEAEWSPSKGDKHIPLLPVHIRLHTRQGVRHGRGGCHN